MNNNIQSNRSAGTPANNEKQGNMKNQTHTPKQLARTLNSVLKKLDSAQDYLGGDESESQQLRRELDKADHLVLEARSQLGSLLIKLDPQAARCQGQRRAPKRC